MKKTIAEGGIKASITPGLGPAFIALGHKFVKEGGRLAFVIPKGLLTGVEWEPTRLLIGNGYHLEYVVVSHEPQGWFFSESTKLSECLIVAKRLKYGEKAGATTVINLWKKPASSLQALVLVHAIRNTAPAKLNAPSGIAELRVDGDKFGEVLEAPPERIRKADWAPKVQFAHTDLARVAFALSRSRLTLPAGKTYPLPLAPLGSFAQVGPDRRDIHDGFKLTGSVTAFPSFWDHKTDLVRTVAQTPNAYLAPLTRFAPGAIAAGSFHATRGSPTAPAPSSISISGAGRVARWGRTTTSSRRMRRPASKRGNAGMRRRRSPRVGPCGSSTNIGGTGPGRIWLRGTSIGHACLDAASRAPASRRLIASSTTS